MRGARAVAVPPGPALTKEHGACCTRQNQVQDPQPTHNTSVIIHGEAGTCQDQALKPGGRSRPGT